MCGHSQQYVSWENYFIHKMDICLSITPSRYLEYVFAVQFPTENDDELVTESLDELK